MDFSITELLIAVGVVTGVGTLLSIFIVVADATIGDYGEKTLTINDDRTALVEGGQPLLSALKEQGIFIPSACGGRGSCGLCKVKVLEGGGDHLPTELPLLSAAEITEGVRISCQLKVKADMKLQIPEELFNIRQFSARVARLVDLTHDIKGVFLELDEEIHFKPGQFVQLEVPEYELTAEPVYRAYSVASVPSSSRMIELQIKLVPGGICTTYVHKHLKEGDTVTLNGPYGDFFLRDTGAEMICMAVGSGMAPIKSIISHMAEQGIGRKVTYFYGARTRADLFDTEAFAEFSAKLPNFTFIPVLSRPTPECCWEGEVGRINTILPNHFPSGEGMEAYLCGAPQALDAFMAALKEIGVAEDHIYYDPFA